jgi:hypothetical protein
MIRLIGILVGSAFAVGFLIVTFGVPALEAPPDEPVSEAEAVVNATIPPPKPAVTDQEPEPEVAVAAIADNEPSAPPDASPDAADSTSAAVEPLEPPEERWYAFWSPFRSEIAADGFVAQLQRTTGLDYRVVKLKPGVYEVAFAYADDDEIQSKLTQISTATGLDLSGG